MDVAPPMDRILDRPGAEAAGPAECRPSGRVTVTRIGTQVVVRLSGVVDDQYADRLTAALDEVADLALRRVVVDLDDVQRLEDAGLAFLGTLHRRWTLRLLNAPAGLRHRIASGIEHAS